MPSLRGVSPSADCASICAPSCTMTLITSTCPLYAAPCSGVNPFTSFASLFTPSCTSTLIASTCPSLAATCNAVSPLAPFASLSAPSSTNTRNTSTCPLAAAQCSAVAPRASRSSTFTPMATSLRTSATSPLAATWISFPAAGVPARPPACVVLVPPPLPAAAAAAQLALTLWHREHTLSGASEAPLLLPHAAHAPACDAAAVVSTLPRPAAVRSACSAASFLARAVRSTPAAAASPDGDRGGCRA
jgi:hypothetical protein